MGGVRLQDEAFKRRGRGRSAVAGIPLKERLEQEVKREGEVKVLSGFIRGALSRRRTGEQAQWTPRSSKGKEAYHQT